MKSELLGTLHPRSRNAPQSELMEIINYGGRGKGIIPLWAGEGDLPTPDFIHDAARHSLERGETFYTWQRGIPELRQALADYHWRVYSRSFSPERFFVTGSGMQAIQLCIQAVVGPGDEVVVITPTWPNFIAALGISGGVPVEIPMECSEAGWIMDLDRIKSAINSRTKALFLNSPCNPTGWVANHDQLKSFLELARKYGLWVVADEVYGMYYFRNDFNRAPSFYDIMSEEDRVLFPNTMSKNWAMTGWRVGWISAPPELGDVFENLIQNSTSGVATFMQRGCVEALNSGDDFLRQQIENAKQGRELVAVAFKNQSKVQFNSPEGTFYQFFSILDPRSSMEQAKSIVDEISVGLAPGSAFGSGGEGYMRLCFIHSKPGLEEALARICNWLEK